jgi:hypothetical protein
VSSKYLTIEDLETGIPTDPIWALNGSAESDAGQVGDVHIGVPKLNGSKIDPLFVPQTWLPSRLTDQISRAQLLAASEFRQAVNRSLIVIISDEYAKKLLAGDGADEEKDRLTQQKRTVREATAARSITQSNTDIINTSELEDEASKPTTRPADEMDPSFEMFANNLKSKTDVEAMNLIRSRGKVTRKEVAYLVKELHDKEKTVAMLKARSN